MKKIALLSALIVATVACGQDPTTAKPSAAVTVGDREFPPGFIVSFISIGSGIDRAAFEATEALVARFDSEGKVEATSLTRKGREGETDLCVEFTDSSFSAEFLSDFHAEIGVSSLVGITSTATCTPQSN